MTGDPDLDGPHWRFALAFYSRPGVQEACLRLQDEAGLDVVFLIAALHIAMATGQPPSHAELAAAFAGIAGWREASVLPLRAGRRALKELRSDVPDPRREAFRNRVKVLELEAEQIELAALAARLGRDGTPTSGSPGRQPLSELIGEVFAAQSLEAPRAELAGAVGVIADAAASIRP